MNAMFDLQKDLVERGSDSKFIITFFMKPDNVSQSLKITKSLMSIILFEFSCLKCIMPDNVFTQFENSKKMSHLNFHAKK